MHYHREKAQVQCGQWGATAEAKCWTKSRLHTFRHLTDTSRYFSGNCSRYLEVLVNDWLGNCQVLGRHICQILAINLPADKQVLGIWLKSTCLVLAKCQVLDPIRWLEGSCQADWSAVVLTKRWQNVAHWQMVGQRVLTSKYSCCCCCWSKG